MVRLTLQKEVNKMKAGAICCRSLHNQQRIFFTIVVFVLGLRGHIIGNSSIAVFQVVGP